MSFPYSGSRSAGGVALALAAALLAGCCDDGTCVKEPPCRPCENPCRLTPIQKRSLEAHTHAIAPGPVVYRYDDAVYVLFTGKGREEFEKDPDAFAEKGAIRIIKGGKTWRVDVKPGDDVDLASFGAAAVPYRKPAQ